MNKFYFTIRLFFLAVLLFSNKNVNAQIPELIYYKFETAPSNVIPNQAQPATAVGMGGTIVGAHTIGGVGQFGQALVGAAGSSTANNVNTGWSANMSGSWTISMWITVDNTTTTNYFFGDNTSASLRCFTGGAAGDGIRLTGPFTLDLTTATNIKGLASVIHYVRDVTAGTLSVYVNGVFNNSITTAVNLTGTTGPFTVGGYLSSNALSTKMDEFRFYNRALTATEIANTWNVDLSASAAPCAIPSGIAASGVTTTDATLNWNTIPTVDGYEYVVNQVATDPATAGTLTTSTTYTATGLTPNTTYYLHLRTKCSASSFSSWTLFTFKTKAPCSEPTPVTIDKITNSSADIKWTAQSASLSYEYFVDTLRALPATGYTNAMGTQLSLNSLKSDKWYYIHIRSLCDGGLSSAWYLDSFKTKRMCMAPELKITNLNTTEAVGYWAPIEDAINYEYSVDNSSKAPVKGTKILQPSFHISALKDGVEYFFHARCNCQEGDYFSSSEWTTVDFKTFPTSVGNHNNDQFSIAAFPNPAHDNVTIRLSGTKENATLILQDIKGQVLQTIPVKSDMTNIDMQQLPAGVYLIKYTDNVRAEVIKIAKD